MIGKRFREYFTFTKKERNGIIVLLFILFITFILRIYQLNKSYGDIVLMDEEYKSEIEDFESSLKLKKEKPRTYSEKITKSEKEKQNWTKPVELFNFDPNQVTSKELAQLGFAEKQIEILNNYREKGGLFFKKNDLLKIYGVGQEQYNFLEPYIVIESKEKYKTDKLIHKELNPLVDINNASAEDLKQLNGIGEAYANRIIKYRTLLGGYYSKEQLIEVYGLDSVKFYGIKDQIIIDTSKISKISLNESDYKSLLKHPYLNQYQTESILKYREVMGDFNKIEQIYMNKLLTKEEYLKLKPYLKLN